MSSLEGKVIVVTGGTQGVGEAVATQCARRGGRGVVICGRQRDRGGAVAARLEELACEAEYVPADLAVVDEGRQVVTRCA